MTTSDRILAPAALPPRHGGALLAASRRHGIPKADWLDLSTGLNPDPWPVPPLADDAFTRLPDPDDIAALLDAARRAYGVPHQTKIVAVPGSDIALRLIPQLVAATDAGIFAPTYGGHAEAWRQAGHRVVEIGGAPGSDFKPTLRVLVLANPNNPDGRLSMPGTIERLLAQLPQDGLLLVDEAFADLDESASLAGRIADPRLIVLRSFGKFYGLAGLRLGFVIGRGQIVSRLGELMGDWPVSGPAVAIGRAALVDEGWRTAARRSLAERRAALDALLAAHGFTVAGGTDLFRLLRDTRAWRLHESLAQSGIWTRIFNEIPDALRIGLPRASELPRLAAALENWAERA